jgi:hypothetical protein
MKFATDRPYADPAKAARKLVEIANSVEAVQDGRIYIEMVNAPFLYEHKGSPAEYKAGLDLAIERGWLVLHGSSHALPAANNLRNLSKLRNFNSLDLLISRAPPQCLNHASRMFVIGGPHEPIIPLRQIDPNPGPRISDKSARWRCR